MKDRLNHNLNQVIKTKDGELAELENKKKQDERALCKL